MLAAQIPTGDRADEVLVQQAGKMNDALGVLISGFVRSRGGALLSVSLVAAGTAPRPGRARGSCAAFDDSGLI
jgi:hypothetical protein